MMFATFLAVSGMSGIVGSMLCTLVLRVTLTRRLKKDLQPTNDYWETGTLDFGFLNTFLFAWACVLPYMQRSDMFKGLYPDLKVKVYANWFERCLAYVTIVGVFVFFICGVLFIVIEP